MNLLKLMALDEEDLEIISAYTQDAVFKSEDLDFRVGEKRFVLLGNRFVWEEEAGKQKKVHERRRMALHFNRVTAVRSRGFKRGESGRVLSMLTVNFVPGEEAPEGRIELIFAGNAAIELDVECIEVQLTDLGSAWETRFRPTHGLSDAQT